MTPDADAPEPDVAALMTRLAITRTLVEQFHYAGWRYSNLSDAVAQARRDAGASPSTDA